LLFISFAGQSKILDLSLGFSPNYLIVFSRIFEPSATPLVAQNLMHKVEFFLMLPSDFFSEIHANSNEMESLYNPVKICHCKKHTQKGTPHPPLPRGFLFGTFLHCDIGVFFRGGKPTERIFYLNQGIHILQHVTIKDERFQHVALATNVK
jgi:hypothetical protein